MTFQDGVTTAWPHMASFGGAIIGMGFAPSELNRRGRLWLFCAGLFCAMFVGPIINLVLVRSDALDVRAFCNFIAGVCALATLPRWISRATEFADKWNLVKRVDTLP